MDTDQPLPEFAADPDVQLAAQFVAHRGDSARFPENTRCAIEAALQCGARYVEFDVQFTRDHEAMVLHDADLRRITGRRGNVMQLSLAELANYTAHLPEKFGDRFSAEPVATLKTIVTLLREWPQVTAFVELKRASIRHFGAGVLLEKLQEILLPIRHQAVLISFDAEAIALAKSSGFEKTGWVFDEWNGAALATAQQLQPDYLFTDVDCIPPTVANDWAAQCQRHLQSPPAWQWVLYEIHDFDLAQVWARRGVTLTETDHISTMLQASINSDKRSQPGNE